MSVNLPYSCAVLNDTIDIFKSLHLTTQIEFHNYCSIIMIPFSNIDRLYGIFVV